MSTKVARVDIFTHNVKFSHMLPAAADAIRDFCRTLVSFEIVQKGRRKVRQTKAVYAASPINRSEVRIHRNLLDDAFNYLMDRGYDKSLFDIHENEVYGGVDVDFKLKDTREPRDYQKTLIDYMVSPGSSKIITLGTGGGKTFSALKAVYQIGKRLAIVVPGKYVDKWVGDVEGFFNLSSGDLVVVRGSKHLRSVMNMAISGELKAQIIIITSTTMFNYLKDFEYGSQAGYPFKPEELFKVLGVGVKLIDECHQFFHLNFRMDLYSHVAKSLFLSATLESSDPFTNKMLQVIYPPVARMQGRAHPKYIDVSAISYNIDNIKKLPHTRRSMYSHTYFEESIMKRSKIRERYIDFILNLTQASYFDKRTDNKQKMLIFAATKKMCGFIVDAIKARWPDESVARYVGEDAWDNLHNNNIVVSTLGSAGTAVDVVNLRTCLMTPAVSSMQQNIQALGRLRELVNYEGEYPEFLYIYCTDIQKHVQYHNQKIEIFQPRCRTHNQYNSGFLLRTDMRN